MLLWADGFDNYGTTETFMADGSYATADGGALSTSQVATGTHSWHINGNNATSGDFQGLRKVLPSAVDKLGVACRLYFPELPNVPFASLPFSFFASTTSRSQITASVGVNGEFRFYRGAGFSFASFGEGTLIATTDPILVAGAQQHVEIQIYFHNTLGWIRVAVNGVHRYEGTGLDTSYDSTSIASIGIHNHTAMAGMDWNPYMDDLFIYDFTGDASIDTDFCPAVDGSGIATEYIGELQCMYLNADGDGTEADWAKSTGVTGHTLVGETTPNDATYIQSAAAGDLSEFDLLDLPEEITYIRGLMPIGRLSKVDSGAAMIQYGMKSVDSSEDADERPVTVETVYWHDFINTDPNTGAATGTLTFTGQPANGDTVTINGKAYTFQTILTNVDGNVFIGANLAATITNLAAAIELGAGSGTGYAAATTLHPDVAATAGATTLVVTAKVTGTGGNAITTTETSANASWGGATLSGGDGGSRWTRAALNAARLRITRSL
jgi:hypothetical protein